MNKHFRVFAAFIILVFFMLWVRVSRAQNIEVAQVVVNPQENKKTPAGVTVAVYKNNSVTEKQTTGTKGKSLTFPLLDNGEYTFVISRPGYYTYRYDISTKMSKTTAMNIDDMGASEIISIIPDMYRKIEGFNPRLLEAALSKFYYNTGRKRFEEDAAYLKLVKARFDECVKAFTADVEEQKKLIEEIRRREREEEEKEKKNTDVEKTGAGETQDSGGTPVHPDKYREEPASGQLSLTVAGKVTEVGVPVRDAIITVKTFKSSFDLKLPLKEGTYRTDVQGRFSIEFELEKVHKVTFYKNGFYSKTYFVESNRLLGRPFEKSYRFELEVELNKVLNSKTIKKPANLGVDFDMVVFFKKEDAFGFSNLYSRSNAEAKDLHRFFREVKTTWEKYYQTHGREALPPVEEEKPVVTTEAAGEQPEEMDVNKHKSDAAKLAEARANKAMKEEEERKLRAEMEERERLAREEEAQRLRELQEAEHKAMLERMTREAEAAAAVEARAVKEEQRYAAARQVQMAKSERNAQITKELATLDRNLKVKTAVEKAKEQQGKPEAATRPAIRPEITVKTDNGYFTDTKTITIKYPGSKMVYREVTTLWMITGYYKNDKEIDEETYKKELSVFNIKP